MEEMKLTDEEIAKAILQSIEYSKTITYFDEWGNCKAIMITDIIDLIHRLQAEKESLKKDYIELDLECRDLRTELDNISQTLAEELAEHEEFTKEAKAEIERLTEEESVKAWKKGNCNGHAIYGLAYEQARKETAEKFAERLKAVLKHPLDNPLHSVIDEICKEITEDSK